MATEAKWGILGCANIAQKVCEAIKEAKNAKVVAVASRSQEKAKEFIDANCPGATAYGAYEQLLDDPEVQVVYFPVPTGMRTEWILKAAAKKKHILSEKPLGSISDCQSIVRACKDNGVQFMDNTMFMHHERLDRMREVLDDAELFGSARHVISSFTLPFGLDEAWAKGNIRLQRSMEPLGCLGDLGWYCVRLILWAFGYDDPESVSCQFLQETKEGVPTFVTAMIKFTGGRTATFDCSFLHANRQTMEIVGTKSSLRCDDFVIPGKKEEASFVVLQGSMGDKAIEFPVETVKTVETKGCVQHTALIEKYSTIILDGKIDEFWPKVTVQTQMIMSALVISARRSGTWVRPKAPSGGKPTTGMAVPAAAEPAPIVKKKATFTTVSDLNPGSVGFNLQVIVVSIEITEAGEACTATVGDASGVATIVVRGSDKVSLMTEGASLVVRNASVRMTPTGFIRIQVDKWGKVQTSEEEFTFTPKKDNDISAQEYELVAED